MKKTVRVWLNQWFSTAYHIANLIRDDERFAFYLIGSSLNEYSPLRCVCDEWFTEPDCPPTVSGDDAYLSFCKEHGVDIFIRFLRSSPCNLPFKHHEGVPYLLEINTRMSGGIGLSHKGTGVNIPNLAVNLLLGVDKPWEPPLNALSSGACSNVSYVEMPLLLKP